MQLVGWLFGAALVSGVGVTGSGVHSEDNAYRQQIEKSRAARVERLKAPTGWLTLVGLDWLKEGKNTVGSAKDNDIVIAKLPPHFCVIDLKGSKATAFMLPGSDPPGVDVKRTPFELLDDSHENPTILSSSTASALS